MKILILAIIAVVLQQNIKLADGGKNKQSCCSFSSIQYFFLVSCASNPCNLVAGTFDSVTGYCCTDLAPYFNDSVCTCPNNIPPVINGPCRKKSKK
jgi:hypothetical protein